jgi:hypothetical protein
MSEEFSAAITALKGKAMRHVETLKALPEMAELIKVHSALNTLEDLCSMDKTPLSDLFGLESSKPLEKQAALVRPGEFFGKKPLEAAKIYLKRRNRQPASLEEIIDNLAAGSCEVKNKEELRTSLARSTFEIARLNDNLFGMLEWYPDVQNQRLSTMKKRGGLMSPPPQPANIPGSDVSTEDAPDISKDW